MTSSRYPQITDELLSAYIDDAVTKEEKGLIETAINDEPAIAWRLETLRYTINLLSSLPAVTLPRSFALSELQATGQVAGRTGAQSGRSTAIAQAPAWRIQAGLHNLGESWRNFWQIGNLFLRNATAVSLAIFLALIVSKEFVAQTALPSANRNSQPSSSAASVQSYEKSVATQSSSSTAMTQASKASVTNSPSPTLAQPTLASQPEVANRQAAPASSQAESASVASTTAADAAVSAAAAPLPDSTRAGFTGQEDSGTQLAPPGPEGQGGFAPPAAPASDAPSMQLATTLPSPLDKQSEVALPTEVTTPTQTVTTTDTILVDKAQSQATAETTSLAPTLTPAATKLVTNNQTKNAQTVTAPVVNGPLRQWSWLSLAQVMSAFVTLILGALWWRSGELHYRVRR